MAVVNFKRYHVALAETFKRFNSKGCAHLSYSAIIGKRQFEKKQGILFSEHKTKVQCSSRTQVKKGIWNFLSEELNIPNEVLWCTISKLPRQVDKNKTHVLATMDFLRQYGFENSVIAESVIICFYPIEVVKEGLQQVVKNEDKLARFGLIGGFTKTKSKLTHGSKLKDKRLQLCLYYMNLPHINNNAWKVSRPMKN